MEVLAFTLCHILYVTFARKSRVPPLTPLHISSYPFTTLPLCTCLTPFPSLPTPSPSPLHSVLEREVPCVETRSRQGPKHFRPISGSRGQQSLHTGSDVLQVSTARLRQTQGKRGVNKGYGLKLTSIKYCLFMFISCTFLVFDIPSSTVNTLSVSCVRQCCHGH